MQDEEFLEKLLAKVLLAAPSWEKEPPAALVWLRGHRGGREHGTS